MPYKATRAIQTIALLATLLLQGCSDDATPGHVLDEAAAAGRAASTFKQSEDPYFHDMDSDLTLTPQEVTNRNM